MGAVFIMGASSCKCEKTKRSQNHQADTALFSQRSARGSNIVKTNPFEEIRGVPPPSGDDALRPSPGTAHFSQKPRARSAPYRPLPLPHPARSATLSVNGEGTMMADNFGRRGAGNRGNKATERHCRESKKPNEAKLSRKSGCFPKTWLSPQHPHPDGTPVANRRATGRAIRPPP
jgi:hypothetical protein